MRLFIAALGLLLLSGCAGSLDVKAMQRHNRFAVVSITGVSSGFGFMQAEDTKLVTTAGALVVRELQTSKRFDVVNPEAVKRDRNYAAIKGDEPSFLTLQVATGYKKFDISDEEAHIAALRKDLRLTGVIIVSVGFTKKSSGVSVSGLLPIPIPVSAGSVRGEANLTIIAYDSKNNVIWSDSVRALTKDSVGSVMGISHLQTLHPQLLDAARDAAEQALKNLNEKMTSGA
jgi:hypothetical protein